MGAKSWPQVQKAVDSCLDVLQQYDIFDVEVEMISTAGALDTLDSVETQYSGENLAQEAQSLRAELETSSDPKACQLINATEFDPEYMVFASECLGTSLTTSKTGELGCKGPYVDVEYEEDAKRITTTATLTSRHVLLTNAEVPSTVTKSHTDPTPVTQLSMSILSQRSCEETALQKYYILRYAVKQCVARREEALEKNDNSAAAMELGRVTSIMERMRTQKERIWDIMKYTDMVIGKVPDTLAPKPSLRDWALVSLEMGVFPSGSPKNRLYVPDTAVSTSINNSALSMGIIFPNMREDVPDMHEIRGTVTLEELQRETPSCVRREQDIESRGFIVCKYGPSTGLRFGVSNRYGCVERIRGANVWHLMVYGWREGDTILSSFSRQGDSGAAVVTLDGRLIGTLAGGDDLDDQGLYVSWVTPWEALQ